MVVGERAIGEGEAGDDVARDVEAGEAAEESGYFDAADVVARDIMGAGFEEEDAGVRGEGGDGWGAVEIEGEKAFGTSEEDGEAGKVDGVGDERSDEVEDLAVGDDKARGREKRSESRREFGLAADDGGGVVVEDVADDLDLREDEATFGGGGVDGSDQEDGVGGRDDIGEERGVEKGRVGERLSDASEEGVAEVGAADREEEDRGIVVGLDTVDEVGVGREEVDFGIDEEERYIVGLTASEEGDLLGVEMVVGEEDDGEVDLVEDLERALDALRAE